MPGTLISARTCAAEALCGFAVGACGSRAAGELTLGLLSGKGGRDGLPAGLAFPGVRISHVGVSARLRCPLAVPACGARLRCPLAVPACGARLRCPLAVPACGARLRCPLAVPACGARLRCPLAVPACGARLRCPLAVPACGARLRCPLAAPACGARLRRPLAAPACGARLRRPLAAPACGARLRRPLAAPACGLLALGPEHSISTVPDPPLSRANGTPPDSLPQSRAGGYQTLIALSTRVWASCTSCLR